MNVNFEPTDCGAILCSAILPSGRSKEKQVLHSLFDISSCKGTFSCKLSAYSMEVEPAQEPAGQPSTVPVVAEASTEPIKEAEEQQEAGADNPTEHAAQVRLTAPADRQCYKGSGISPVASQQPAHEARRHRLRRTQEKGNPARKRKVAVFLAYVGHGYQGMQRNPGARTIEDELFRALHAAGAISDVNNDEHGYLKV
jgi:hypothetical protein